MTDRTPTPRTDKNVLEEAAAILDNKAFLCHTHDDFGKGREQGILDCVAELRELAALKAAPQDAADLPRNAAILDSGSSAAVLSDGTQSSGPVGAAPALPEIATTLYHLQSDGVIDRAVVAAKLKELRAVARAQTERAERLQGERDAALAKVDALMLEYCPDEMTPEQIENWKRHQKPVTDEEAAIIAKSKG